MSPSLHTAVYTVSTQIWLTLAVPWSSLPLGTCLASASACLSVSWKMTRMAQSLLSSSDTHIPALVQTLKKLSVCVCVAARSHSGVGLWQLSLRRGCADQDWAEYQGLAVLKGELHDSSPTWESYLLAAASPTVPSSPEPSREDTCLSDLPLTAWLTQWLCVCLTSPPVCLWSNDWLALLCFARV